MEIELLVLPDCPHRKAAEDLLHCTGRRGSLDRLSMLTFSDSGDAVRQGFASCSARNPGKVVIRLHVPAMSPSANDTARAYVRRLPVEVRQRLLGAIYAGTPFRTIFEILD